MLFVTYRSTGWGRLCCIGSGVYDCKRICSKFGSMGRIDADAVMLPAFSKIFILMAFGDACISAVAPLAIDGDPVLVHFIGTWAFVLTSV
jgi:hypothetical protein